MLFSSSFLVIGFLKRILLITVPIILATVALLLVRSRNLDARTTTISSPAPISTSGVVESPRSASVAGASGAIASAGASEALGSHRDIQVLTMAQVIDRAKAVRESMSENLSDYTARFVKQERGDTGELGEETVIRLKVQTRLRNSSDDAPMRVFLRFEAPQSQAGRKVIWGSDLYDGKMAVHETGMLLGLKTIYLDPNGMIAMQGQKHPVSEIGLVKLVEKLIERGGEDIDDPDLQITLTPNYEFDGRQVEFLRVVRTKRKEKKTDDDYQTAEIFLDVDRQLILRYRSFGWPTIDGEGPPLLESYTYENVELNVGLTDTDFDVTNPEYGYPAF
ncbi:DUF1571 domain-containing protein [Rubripirellula amarantea]|nr:DUF1571 domain-containing protein [Rubripirellula amarantea]